MTEERPYRAHTGPNGEDIRVPVSDAEWARIKAIQPGPGPRRKKLIALMVARAHDEALIEDYIRRKLAEEQAMEAANAIQVR